MKKLYTIIVAKANGEHAHIPVSAPGGIDGALAAVKTAMESCGEGAELMNVNVSAVAFDLN